MKKLAFILLLALMGCDDSSPEHKRAKLETAIAADKQAFANPTNVGTTADGQPVFRVKVTNVPNNDNECCDYRPHWVYYVGSTMSVNAQVSEGKSSVVRTTVTINGKALDLTQARVQIDAALAEQQKKELETYRELKSKYEDKK